MGAVASAVNKAASYFIRGLMNLFRGSKISDNPILETMEENAGCEENPDWNGQAENDRKQGGRADNARRNTERGRDGQAENDRKQGGRADNARRNAERSRPEAGATAYNREQTEAEIRERALMSLKDAVQPVEWPTRRELDETKRAYEYKEGLFHFAIAGAAGTGKSSLINAFRGLSNNDPRAASTGIVETTAKVTRYPDPNPRNPFVWYDVPGAGTLDIPDWQYFNKQGLYIFDCIIVLFDNRFTAIDVAILKNCQRFNIPSYIVRSKSNQHIRNVMRDLGGDSDDEEDEKCAELFPQARATFIKETRKNVKDNLKKAELPPTKGLPRLERSHIEDYYGRGPKEVH